MQIGAFIRRYIPGFRRTQAGQKHADGSPPEVLTLSAVKKTQTVDCFQKTPAAKSIEPEVVWQAGLVQKTLDHLSASIAIPKSAAVRKSTIPADSPLSSLRDKINEQAMALNGADIENMLGDFKENRSLALNALDKMTQFGNMQSFDHLLNALKTVQNTHKLTSPIQHGLGAFINYLVRKTRYPLSSGFDITINRFHSRIAIMLDETTLRYYEQHPERLRQSVDANTVLLYPDGWLNGINLFQQGDTAAMKEKLKVVVQQADKLMKTEHMTEEQAVDAALIGPIQERLANITPEAPKNLVRIQRKDGLAPTPEKIEARLAPDVITEEQLLKVDAQLADKFDTETRKHFWSLLSERIEVLSPRRISVLLKKQHEQILAHAKARGIAADKIYYLVHEDNKSFTAINFINQIVNPDIPPDRIIRQLLGALPMESNDHLVVVLDDFSGSGETLRKCVRYHVEDGGYDKKAVLAPMFITASADRELQRFYEQGCVPMPCVRLPKLQDLPAYQALSPESREKLDALLGYFGQQFNEVGSPVVLEEGATKPIGLGHDHTGSAMVFPWIAPDNNLAAFNRLLAKNFIFNQAVTASTVKGIGIQN